MTRLSRLVAVSRIAPASLLLSLVAPPLAAQSTGTAGGSGVIERQVPSKTPGGWPETEKVPFLPRYAFAYRERGSEDTKTWLVLTEKEPPVKAWMTAPAKGRAEVLRAWCDKEKAPFVAAEVNPDGSVELFFLCPGNGFVNTEMVNTINGLASVVITFEQRNGQRLKGTLRGGEGSCGDGVYCEQTEDYSFDAPLAP